MPSIIQKFFVKKVCLNQIGPEPEDRGFLAESHL